MGHRTFQRFGQSGALGVLTGARPAPRISDVAREGVEAPSFDSAISEFLAANLDALKAAQG